VSTELSSARSIWKKRTIYLSSIAREPGSAGLPEARGPMQLHQLLRLKAGTATKLQERMLKNITVEKYSQRFENCLLLKRF